MRANQSEHGKCGQKDKGQEVRGELVY